MVEESLLSLISFTLAEEGNIGFKLGSAVVLVFHQKYHFFPFSFFHMLIINNLAAYNLIKKANQSSSVLYSTWPFGFESAIDTESTSGYLSKNSRAIIS